MFLRLTFAQLGLRRILTTLRLGFMVKFFSFASVCFLAFSLVFLGHIFPSVPFLLCVSMAVVIRLQGLRITAGSEDIRNFFSGLNIPDGGVHIIGGELGEAFILFAGDDDARRAMLRSGGSIKGTQVTLLLSSRSEMQKMLQESTCESDTPKRRIYNEGPRRPEKYMETPGFDGKSLGEARKGIHLAMVNEVGSTSSEPRPLKRRSIPDNSDGLYLYMQGMPFSVTESSVKHFFQGLQVSDVLLLKNPKGLNTGSGFVRFATLHDASEGLKFDHMYMGTRFVEIKQSTESRWVKAGGLLSHPSQRCDRSYRRPSPSPVEERSGRGHKRSGSPVGYRSRSPSVEEYYILLENISFSVEKKEIRDFLYPIPLSDDQIEHMLDENGYRKREVLVMFRNASDYCAALSCHRKMLANRTVAVSPISKELMLKMRNTAKRTRQSESQPPERTHRNPYSDESDRICLYVRNMPFDVRKVEIIDFFYGFGISEDAVNLLQDNRGVGVGEALVTFATEEEALRAQSLDGQRFLGSEVMLKCISRAQMREFGVDNQPTRREWKHTGGVGEGSDLPPDGHSPRFGDPFDTHDCPTEISSYSAGPSGRQRVLKESRSSLDGSVPRRLGPSAKQFDGPTCLKLVNLPPQITAEEIYDFCYGFRVIPGSVSLQYNRHGIPKGTATVVFETRQEAQSAISELFGRPMGTKKIQLVFV